MKEFPCSERLWSQLLRYPIPLLRTVLNHLQPTGKDDQNRAMLQAYQECVLFTCMSRHISAHSSPAWIGSSLVAASPTSFRAFRTTRILSNCSLILIVLLLNLAIGFRLDAPYFGWWQTQRCLQCPRHRRQQPSPFHPTLLPTWARHSSALRLPTASSSASPLMGRQRRNYRNSVHF